MLPIIIAVGAIVFIGGVGYALYQLDGFVPKHFLDD